MKNQGTAATPTGVTIGVKYSVDGTGKTWGSVNGPLAKGASVTIGTNGGAYTIPDGTHTIMAYVDDVNRFAESNETNNKMSVILTVDTKAPTVAITAPVAGAKVSGSAVALSSTATDAVGVVGVQYQLDAKNLGAEDTASPYTLIWDSTTATNGAHVLTAIARDAAGNKTTSAAVSIMVSNLPDVIVSSVYYSKGVFSSVVKNQGLVPVPLVTIGVKYYVDGVAKTWGSVDGPLAAGASVTIGTSTTYTIPDGVHTIEAWADGVNRFAESDETNNKTSVTLTVDTTSALQWISNNAKASLNTLLTNLADPTKTIISRDLSAGALAAMAVNNDVATSESLMQKLFSKQNMSSGNIPWVYQGPAQTDYNSIEFCMSWTAPLFIRYNNQFSDAFKAESLPHLTAALKAVQNHVVQISYTNIYLMKAVNIILLGQIVGDQSAITLGDTQLKDWLAYTKTNGIIEYDSSTYYGVDLNVLSMGYLFATDTVVRQDLASALGIIWKDIAADYFAGAECVNDFETPSYFI